VPLATAEGTLVASYNRGMKLLYEAGGVTTTVLDDRMQRAPAFTIRASSTSSWSPTSRPTRRARR
jgi:hydroxymethylglutaryl-CoA reductase (NADPH)